MARHWCNGLCLVFVPGITKAATGCTAPYNVANLVAWSLSMPLCIVLSLSCSKTTQCNKSRVPFAPLPQFLQLELSYLPHLQMKHILFARENTAPKRAKTTNKKILKIWLGNPGNISRGKAPEYRKSWRLDDTIEWEKLIFFGRFCCKIQNWFCSEACLTK